MELGRDSVWSRSLDMLRFPLALFVIMEHVFVANMFGLTTTPDSLAGCMILFVKVFISGQSVPVYFFISGFLFFLGYRLTMESFSKKISTRVKSLLVPYIIWNVLAVIALYLPLLPGLGSLMPTLSATVKFDLSLSSLWEWFVMSDTSYHLPADPAMWYIRNLMVVCLFTPFIGLLLRRFGAWVPFVLGVIWYICAPMHITNYSFSASFFFFTFGAYMSFKKKDMTAAFGKWRTVSFVAYPVICILCLLWCFSDGSLISTLNKGVTGNMWYLKNLAILAGVPFAYNIAAILVQRHGFRVHSTLTASAFFLYSAHQIVIFYLPALIHRVIKPATAWSEAACYLLLLALLVALLLGIYVAMRRLCPRFLMLFTGGRS